MYYWIKKQVKDEIADKFDSFQEFIDYAKREHGIEYSPSLLSTLLNPSNNITLLKLMQLVDCLGLELRLKKKEIAKIQVVKSK